MWQRFLAILCLCIYSTWAMAFDWFSPNLDSRLWKISKAGQPDSYLLGSYHMGSSSDRLSPQLLRLIKQSDLVITEVLMPVTPQLANSNDIQAMRGQLYANGGRTLSSQIGQTEFQQLKQRMAAHANTKPAVARLDDLTPWGALMMQSSIRPQGLQSANGVDILVSKAAWDNHIRLGSLERYQDITSVYRQLPLAKIRELIDANNRYPEQSEAKSRRLYELYSSKRYGELMRLSSDDSQYNKGLPPESVAYWRQWLERDVLQARNRDWLPQIVQQLPKQSTFIAVGIAHLVDDTGIITQLRQHGYTVEAVSE